MGQTCLSTGSRGRDRGLATWVVIVVAFSLPEAAKIGTGRGEEDGRASEI